MFSSPETTWEDAVAISKNGIASRRWMDIEDIKYSTLKLFQTHNPEFFILKSLSLVHVFILLSSHDLSVYVQQPIRTLVLSHLRAWSLTTPIWPWLPVWRTLPFNTVTFWGGGSRTEHEHLRDTPAYNNDISWEFIWGNWIETLSSGENIHVLSLSSWIYVNLWKRGDNEVFLVLSFTSAMEILIR